MNILTDLTQKYFTGEKKISSLYFPGFTAILSIMLLLLVLLKESLRDEWILVNGAERILAGEIPYRDFFEFITPGGFYFVAFLFTAFSRGTITLRLGFLVFACIALLTMYFLGRHIHLSSEASALAVLTYVIIGLQPAFYLSHHWLSTFSFLISAFLFVRYTRRYDRFYLVMASLGASATWFFLQHVGTYLFAGMLVAAFTSGLLKKRRYSRLVKDLFLLTGIFALPIFLYAFYLYLNQALSEAKFQLFDWIFQNYTRIHASLTYASDLEWLAVTDAGPWVLAGSSASMLLAACYVFLVPLFAAYNFIKVSLLLFSKKRQQEGMSILESDHVQLILGLLAFFHFLAIFPGPLVMRIIWSTPLMLLLAFKGFLRVVNIFENSSTPENGRNQNIFDNPSEAFVSNKSFFKTNTQWFSMSAPGISGILRALAFVLFILLILRALHTSLEAMSYRYPVYVPGSVIFMPSEEKKQAATELLEYLTSQTTPMEEVFFFPYPSPFQFLTRLKNPVRYDVILIGYTTENQLSEIIQTLEEKKLRTLVFVKLKHAIQDWQLDRSILFSYIRANYYPVKDLDYYVIFQRKSDGN